jgi:nucleotide-binding universal stress UspA family protein
MSPRKQENQFALDQGVVFANALVGVDGSSTGRDAIVLANLILDGTGRLTLAHVVLNPAPRYQNFHSTPAGRAAREMLKREREATGILAELTGMFSASVGRGLHQLADDCRADLLVVGSSSRGPIGRVLAGDDARGTVVGASCAVAVAPLDYAGRAQPIKTVGVAYNATPEAELALAVGRSLGARHQAKLRALTVLALAAADGGYPEALGPDGPRTIQELMQEATDRLASLGDVDGRVTVGIPSEELLAFGDEVDVLVVGSRGSGPLRRLLLGSTSLQLTREARCPLLVTPRPSPPATQGRR